MKLESIVFGLAALCAVNGCVTKDACQALGSCGGDLVGSNDGDGDGIAETQWNLSGACANEVFLSPINSGLVNQPPPLRGEIPVERTHANWCSDMVISQQKAIVKINPWFPAIPAQSGSVTYLADGTFKFAMNYFGPQIAEYPAGCFESQGFLVVPDGSETSSATLTCSDFQEMLRVQLQTEPNVSGVSCGPDDKGGCNCVYDLLLVTGVTGTWLADGNVVSHYDKTAKEPTSRAEYCVSGNSLELSGYRRTFLFNQPHIRSLVLAKE